MNNVIRKKFIAENAFGRNKDLIENKWSKHLNQETKEETIK